MTETVQVYIDYAGEPRLVGHLRYIAKSRRQSSVFE